MTHRMLMAGAAWLALVYPATADMSVETYRLKDDAVAFYLTGVYSGLMWAGEENAARGAGRFFCQPTYLVILPQQLYSVIDGYLKRHPSHSRFPVDALLMKGLMEEYPCEPRAAGPKP